MVLFRKVRSYIVSSAVSVQSRHSISVNCFYLFSPPSEVIILIKIYLHIIFKGVQKEDELVITIYSGQEGNKVTYALRKLPERGSAGITDF